MDPTIPSRCKTLKLNLLSLTNEATVCSSSTAFIRMVTLHDLVLHSRVTSGEIARGIHRRFKSRTSLPTKKLAYGKTNGKDCQKHKFYPDSDVTTKLYSFEHPPDSKVRISLYSIINRTTGKYCSVAFI